MESETDVKSRQQVSYDQLKALVDFMKGHPELAKGLARGRRGKLQALKLWNQCAKKLNSIKDGADKDRKGWSKYWCDWKYRVRRRALEFQVAKNCARPPPEGVSPLSPLEEELLSIVGESIEGFVIRSDPLGNEDTAEIHENDANTSGNPVPTTSGQVHENNDANTSANPVASTSRLKRRRSSFDCKERDNNSSPKRKPEVENEDSGDMEDEAERFLQIEHKKLDNLKKINESILKVDATLKGLVDILMSYISGSYKNGKGNLN